MNSETSKLSPYLIAKLKGQALFKDVSEEDLQAALTRVEELHLLKDELAFRKGERYHKGIYFLYNGKITLSRANSTISITCENGPVGLSTFLGKTMYTMNAIAESDCDLLFVHELCIYRLMELSDSFRTRLIADIQLRLNNLENSKAFRMSSSFQTVASCMSAPVITLQTGKTVMEASRLMKEHKIGSLLVVNRKQIVKGLLTARHLVLRFMTDLEDNIKYPEIEKYMDTTPLMFPPEFPIMEAINELQLVGATHAIVMKNGKPAGILSLHDISLMLFENASLYSTHIESIETLAELKTVFSNIYRVAKTLATSSRISREELTALSSIHYAIQRKAFQITSGEFMKSHKFNIIEHKYSYLILGSGARREMDLVPFLNNAVIVSDETSDADFKLFVKFAAALNKNLTDIGYSSNIMDMRTNDMEFVMRESDWIKHIDIWTSKDNVAKYSYLSTLMDISTFDGDITLAWKVRNHMMKKISDKPSVLAKMLNMYPAVKIPVSQFGSFIVEKEGDHKGMFNLRTEAFYHLVNVTRLLSLYANITDMGTIERIEHLARKKIISDEMAEQTISAFDTIVETLINEQVNLAINSQPVTCYIDPSSLSLFYQEKLKRALQFLTIYTSFGINLLKQL